MFGKDLIALNIINDMQVSCIHQDCPWKSTLSELENHVKYCLLDETKIPEYLKNKLRDSNSTVRKIEDTDDITTADDYLNFKSSSNLFARLYSQNKELMTSALDDNKEEAKDFLDLIKDDRSNSMIDINRIENVDPNNVIKRSKC